MVTRENNFDSTEPASLTWSSPVYSYSNMKVGKYTSEQLIKKLELPTNRFKKNDTVKFKYKTKILSGKIIKLGKCGVNVICNGLFYYCYDYQTNGIFSKSSETKNYK